MRIYRENVRTVSINTAEDQRSSNVPLVFEKPLLQYRQRRDYLLGLSEKDRCSKSSEDTEPDGKLEKL